MQVVNPYYARESAVGPVFDVASHKQRPWYSPSGLMLVSSGIACAIIGSILLFPNLLELVHVDLIQDRIESVQETIEEGYEDYAWQIRGAAMLVFAVSYVCLSVSVADQLLQSQGPMYLRVGPGGLSLRVPNGLDAFRPWYKLLELDAPWDEIVDYRVVQHKQMGAISPNAGNTHALLHLRLRSGTKHSISLSGFREPARIIWKKMQDSVEMVPMDFAPGDGSKNQATRSPHTASSDLASQERKSCVTGWEAQRHQIEGALQRLVGHQSGSVIFSDTATEKFVQFCVVDGALWVDLPAQALTDDQHQRAANYFRGMGYLSENGGTHFDQTSVSVRSGFQLSLGNDVSRAVQLVQDMFQQVYLTRAGFEMEIDEQGS